MSDADDFAEFVAARSGALLRTAYLLTGDRHGAEDLVQSVLIKVVPRWGKLREPEPYLRRMLVNESISRWRRPSRREVPVPEVYDAVVSGPDVDQQLVLRQALGRLAPRQRAVIVLRYFNDLTEAQTAEALGIGVGTVKSQARDALSRLRSLVPDLADPSLSERAAGAPTPP